MKTATVRSPFIRAVDAAPSPDRFLPGDGGPARGVTLQVNVPPVAEDPLAVPDFGDTREAVRVAEERLARIRAEEDALSRRRAEMLTFQKDVNEFQTGLAETLERLRALEAEFASEREEGRRCAGSIHRTIQALQLQLQKLDQVRPEGWTKGRLQTELDQALALLGDVEADTRAEVERLERELPPRTKRLRDGWLGRVGYWAVSIFAFLLPLLLFIAVAAILILTALGLV